MIISVLSSIAHMECRTCNSIKSCNKFQVLQLPNNKVHICIDLQQRYLASAYQTTHKEGYTMLYFLLAFCFQNCSIFVFRYVIMYMFNDNINGFGDILEQYMKWDANNYVQHCYMADIPVLKRTVKTLQLLHSSRYTLGL